MTLSLSLSRPQRLALAGVAVLQTLAIGWMVWGRVSLLANGREIVAEVIPVDPRDFFRGDYVVLGYGFSTVQEVALPSGVKTGDAVYATLASSGPASWQIKTVAATHPGAVAADQVVLKARVAYVRPAMDGAAAGGVAGRLRYGIESYFVPEGTGKALEDAVRDKRIEAVLAVDDNGDVAIKGLKVDGQMIAQEPAI